MDSPVSIIFFSQNNRDVLRWGESKDYARLLTTIPCKSSPSNQNEHLKTDALLLRITILQIHYKYTAINIPNISLTMTTLLISKYNHLKVLTFNSVHNMYERSELTQYLI